MQSSSITNLQHQAQSVQERVSWQKEPTPAQSKVQPRKNTFALPEDVVTLSAPRSGTSAPAAGKKPSVPVNSDENKALRENFSIYV